MGTRAWLGIVDKDSSAKVIHCQYDGYPSCLGKELLTYFNDKDKIMKLIELGDIKGIDKGVPEPYNNDSDFILFEDKGYFLENCKEDYTYLFEHEKWYFRKWNGVLEELTITICLKDEE